jgi:hypothetical protein
VLWLWNTTLPRDLPGRVRGLVYGEALRLMILAWLLFGAGRLRADLRARRRRLVSAGRSSLRSADRSRPRRAGRPHGVVLARPRRRGARRRIVAILPIAERARASSRETVSRPDAALIPAWSTRTRTTR